MEYLTYTTIFLVLFLSTLSWSFAKILNIEDFGAVGDGTTDNSQAVMKAWAEACGSTESSTINIPAGKTFLLNTVKFIGPCQAPSIYVEIEGNIVAPSKIEEWHGAYMGAWIVFVRVNGLTVEGNGNMDGQGSEWWEKCSYPNNCPRPMGLKFHSCNNVKFNDLHITNTPAKFLSVSDCRNVTISNLTITNPENSANTDGMDITHSINVLVTDCVIATGDDCVAILPGCSNLNVTRVTCGPGHGISIGSMGDHGAIAQVEDIHVKNCTFYSSLNGAHIKSWQGGLGYARKITFEDIILIGTYNPIMIDQFYCPLHNCQNQTNAVNISDVSFTGFQGTSLTDNAISLLCSETLGCTNIYLDQINITAVDPTKKVTSRCTNAHGKSFNTYPAVDCLLP